jgi:hypothetical protein
MAFLTYLQAGFGPVLGTPFLERIAALGFTGIRSDLTGSPQSQQTAVRELGEFEVLSPIFLFGGGHIEDWTPERFFGSTTNIARLIKNSGYFKGVPVYFELGNEPDIAVPMWRQDPKLLADTFWECYQAVKSIHGEIELVTGGIANLSENGLNWLEEFMLAGVPAKAIVGFHRYPNGYKPELPQKGFLSREHEMNRLRALADGRKLLCTETGLSQGYHREAKKFPLCFMNNKIWLEEEEQAEAFRIEYDFYKRRGVLGMTWYQHRDGIPHGRVLSHYGLYTATGEEKKVVCDTVRGLLLSPDS